MKDLGKQTYANSMGSMKLHKLYECHCGTKFWELPCIIKAGARKSCGCLRPDGGKLGRYSLTHPGLEEGSMPKAEQIKWLHVWAGSRGYAA